MQRDAASLKATAQSRITQIKQAWFPPHQASLQDAAELGRVLARALLPAPIYRLLQASLRALDHGGGLRVRLALDPSLVDLPWEFAFLVREGSEIGGRLPWYADDLAADSALVERRVRHLAMDMGGARISGLNPQ